MNTSCYHCKAVFSNRRNLVLHRFETNGNHFICKGCEAVFLMREKRSQAPQEEKKPEGKLIIVDPRAFRLHNSMPFMARVVTSDGQLTLDAESLKRLQ